MQNEYNPSFYKLQSILDELREKCPWDRKQTIHSLRQLTIEECFELADAISSNDWEGIKEELGDMLLHILFYAKIGREEGKFDIQDVIEKICDKLIYRHPHIYGDVQVKDEEEVKRNWEKLKLKEGKSSVLSGVPKSLPPMVQAMRMQEKAKQVGFEWEKKEDVWHKVREEAREVEEAVSLLDQDANSLQYKERAEEEIGDLLFSIVNYARFLNIDPDQALGRTNKKFINRFQKMETHIKDQGRKLTDMSLEEMDAVWDQVKQAENKKS